MAEIRQTELPGVGVRSDFVTGDGEQLGVLVHHTGRRELLIYDRDDPDACRVVVSLGEDDARTLAELLGVPHVNETLAAMQQRVRELAIDWLPVEASSPLAGRSLRGAAVHSRTGVSVVAIIRGEETVVAPGADDTLEVGDTVVAVGSTAGMKDFLDLLAG